MSESTPRGSKSDMDYELDHNFDKELHLWTYGWYFILVIFCISQ